MINIKNSIKTVSISLVACGLLFASCKKKEETPVAKEPAASFTADKTTGNTPLSVKFTNTSTDATKFSWDFGDGSSPSTEKDPSHVFRNTSTTSGKTYTVTLKASNDAGKSSTISKTINVDAATKPPTPEEMLTGGPWEITAYTVALNGAAATDEYSTWMACTQDDVYIFKTGGTYTAEEGKTKCNASDPTIIDQGTWILSSDGKTLEVDGEAWEFLSPLTANGMKVKFRDEDLTTGDIEIETITFKRN